MPELGSYGSVGGVVWPIGQAALSRTEPRLRIVVEMIYSNSNTSSAINVSRRPGFSGHRRAPSKARRFLYGGSPYAINPSQE